VKRIGLVASNNGFGHARRLGHIALALLDLGLRSTIYATQNQINRLRPELIIKRQFPRIDYVEVRNHGIDGPVWNKTNREIIDPTRIVTDSLKQNDLIISDNVIWPIKYNENFVLFGHFNWLNYWTIMGYEHFSPKVKDVFDEEIALFKKIPIAFQFQNFMVHPNQYAVRNTCPIKLIRYKTDSQLPRTIENSLVAWIAKGTTNLHTEIEANLLINDKIKIIESETYNLVKAKNKPSIVLGRPGLRTIRDCLASGTPFLPIFDNLDVELNSNVTNLSKLSLYFSSESKEEGIDLRILSLLENRDLLSLWSTLWPEISEESSKICEKIIENVTCPLG
jgi:hypothetical protein